MYVCMYVRKGRDLYEGVLSSALCARGKTHCVFMYVMYVCVYVSLCVYMYVKVDIYMRGYFHQRVCKR